jgi:O-antigen ligase
MEKEIYSEQQKTKIAWQETSIGGSIIHRLLVWEYVANETYKKPILGHGIGTSRLIGQDIILNVPNTNQEIKGGIPLHPHNNFLEIWLELGLLGIIIISILWMKIIKYGIQMRQDSYIIGTGVCSSIVTIFIISNLSFGVFQAWWMSSIALIFLIILQFSKKEQKINL